MQLNTKKRKCKCRALNREVVKANFEVSGFTRLGIKPVLSTAPEADACITRPSELLTNVVVTIPNKKHNGFATTKYTLGWIDQKAFNVKKIVDSEEIESVLQYCT